MRTGYGCWLIGWCLCLVTACGWAEPDTAVLACRTDHIPLAASAQMVADPDGTLTPDVVAAMPDVRFRNVVSGQWLGYHGWDWWLRVSLRNATDKPCRRLLQAAPARLRNVQVYVRHGDGWEVMRGGTAYPLREWALPERQTVFPLTLPAHSTIPILVHLTVGGGLVSFTPRLREPERFQQQATYRALLDGLKFGAGVLLVLIGLVLGYIYRRRTLCFMAIAVGSYVIYNAAQANYLFVYLWPSSPGLNSWVRYTLTDFFYVGMYAYLHEIANIRLLGKWWRRTARAVLGMLLLLAVIGIPLKIGMVMIWIGKFWCLPLAVGVVLGWRRRLFTSVYPLVLTGLICARTLVFLCSLLGLSELYPGGVDAFLPTLTIASLLLLATLINQVRLGRRAEVEAYATLNRQRATENERLERTVKQRTDELGRALQARRQLLGRISHDLRSPLTSMIDSVRQWRAGDRRRDYPHLIERHAHQQMDMIDELLEFSRTEALEIKPEPIPGYLYAFLNEVAEQAELTAERHGNRLRCDFAGDLPALVSLDFHYLQRVLTNLLGNASKFTERGTIHFRVEAQPTDNDDNIRLHFAVDDNGPGIAPADRQRLLRPFTRGGRTANKEGHGLGLSIVSQLLEHMGGQLQIDSAPDGGSRFHFELEAVRATENDLEPILEEEGVVDIDGAGHVILIVDDEPQQRELTCDLFDSYGFDSIATVDGHEALDVLQTRSVDLVLTDQYMKGMDGWDLLQAVRNRQPDLPVALYSSVPPRPPADGGNEAAFDAALLKPAGGASLLRRVMSLLEGKTVAESGARVGSG